MDIVERIKKELFWIPESGMPKDGDDGRVDDTPFKAADEIARLRAENERLTKERDEAHYTAHIAETCCARAEERAESAERKVERTTMTDIPDDVVKAAWAILTTKAGLDGVRAAGRVFVEWERAEIRRQMDARLNNYLVDMKPNYDDSITGFNEAWDQMRDVFRSRSADREG